MSENISVRDIRTLPFFWIQRALLDTVKPSWKGLLAYNALAYFASSKKSSCIVGIKTLADLVSVSEDTMRRGIADLVKIKAIRVKRRYVKQNGKQAQLPNEYILIDITAPEVPI